VEAGTGAGWGHRTTDPGDTLTGSGGEARTRLSSHPTSAVAARRFVRQVLDGWEFGEAEAAIVCTDELVTNAIVHVCSDIDVVVRRRGDSIRVEVHDASGRPPLRRVHPLDAERGRGLEVVEALSSSWGVSPTTTGKLVWFELTPEPGPPPLPATSGPAPPRGENASRPE
jgi:anti-sigma regulatory factor (Ser/Thr protein kinase)